MGIDENANELAELANFVKARVSNKKNGIIAAYAAITHEGLIRYLVLYKTTRKLGPIMKTECQSY
jgi:hypothetical protein